MIDTRCAAWRAGMAGATRPGTRAGRRPGTVGAPVAALLTASTGVAAGPAWVVRAAGSDT